MKTLLLLAGSLLFPSLASASGLLYDEDGYVPLGSMSVAVTGDARVATGLSALVFPNPGKGRRTFAIHLPDRASVTGLRFAEGEGKWISAVAAPMDLEAHPGPTGDPRNSIDGNVFVVDLPDLSGEDLSLQVDWQVILRVEEGALALVVPFDEGGFNSSDPSVDVTFSLNLDQPVIEAALQPEATIQAADSLITAAWSGHLRDTVEVALDWTQEPSPFGISYQIYRPSPDPWTGEPEGPGYVLVAIQPGTLDDASRVDQLFTFVLDTSSSMAGAPLETAIAAGATWLADLLPQDRFNVVAYSSQAHAWKGSAQAAEPAEVEDAVDFLERQHAMGLSDPEEGLVTALSLEEDTLRGRSFFGCSGTRRGENGDAPPLEDAPILPTEEMARVAPYVVLLTDGGASVGETDPFRIVDAVSAANSMDASLFAVGVGDEVDQLLLQQLVGANRGEARFAATVEEVPDVVAALEDRLANPLLVQPQIGVGNVSEITPARLPDVSAGYEILLAFRYADPGETALRLTGIQGTRDIDETWTLDLPDLDDRYPAVALAWAALRVAELDAQYLAGDTSVYHEIYDIVSTYGVASEVVTLSFVVPEDPSDTGDAGYAADTGYAALAYSDKAMAGCGCQIPLEPWMMAAMPPLLLAIGASLARRRNTPEVKS